VWFGLAATVGATLALEVLHVADFSRVTVSYWDGVTTWNEVVRLVREVTLGGVERAPATYAGLAAVFLALCLVRVTVRVASATRVPIPWPKTTTQRATRLGIAASGAMIFVPYVPAWLTVALMAVVTTLSIREERQAFVRLVRRGALPGWSLRPAPDAPTDLPVLGWGFGAQEPELLEHTPPGNYREAAVSAVARLARSKQLAGGRFYAGVVLVMATVFAGTLALGAIALVPRPSEEQVRQALVDIL
jgi:hypothetical protein